MDSISYESLSIAQSHPKHLYTLGLLFGLEPAPLAGAKVLELGCASGGNIIPMAYHLPQTSFLGIDYARDQIQRGIEHTQKLQLSNIELRCQSILDFNEKNKYDYIICHGVYSWVDEPVRAKILAICKENLKEKGIAYISYNTFPGWAMANIVRELLLWQTCKIQSPSEKANQGHEVLTQFDEALQEINSAYSHLLRSEVNVVLRHSNSQMLYEHLNQTHYQLYYYQFLEQAQAHQLMVFSDAYLSNDAHEDKQWGDFLHNRRFRCSLIVHQQKASIKLHPDALKALHFPGLYTKPTYDEFIKAAYAGSIRFSAFAPDYSLTSGDKPIACGYARYQAQMQNIVTNRRHENIQLSPIAEIILPYLNGTHDRTALVEIIKTAIDAGEFVLLDYQDNAIIQTAHIQREVEVLLEETLNLLAQQALLLKPD